ncbi:MAG: aldo/keto reductase [Lachnospiraceae bacterium]|nr:aldo/keto reductase [Lachnospiraceae bacterium]
MQYRKLGKTGIEISAIGFGTMRMPTINGVFADIDIEKAKKVIRYAIDNGVNYIDTAYPYHINGNSEKALGEILKDGYRKKVYLGDKLSIWVCDTYEDCEKMFESQLERTGTDYFDLYFLHSLDYNFWAKAKKLNVFKLFDKLKAEGKIKHIGFSFHDRYELFEEIVNAYDWEFCIMQLNYMDTDYQAGLKGLELAAAKEMGVLIMEPLKGGQLAKEPPKSVEEIWSRSKKQMTPAGRGMSFLLNRPEVSCVLSGMNEIEQVDDNIKTAESCKIGDLDKTELQMYKDVREEFSRLIKVACTRCQYCMPCPMGVDIPTNIEYYNMGHMYGTIDHARNFYNRPFFDKKRSTNCINCGICLDKCPQHLNIPEIMEKIGDEWACKN